MQFRSEFTSNQYKYFTENVQQIFEQKHVDFPLRSSNYPRATTALSRINKKVSQI